MILGHVPSLPHAKPHPLANTKAPGNRVAKAHPLAVVGISNRPTTQLSVSDDAWFSIAEALIQSLDAGAAKDRDCVDEVNSMFLPVGTVLFRIPLEVAGVHRAGIYNCLDRWKGYSTDRRRARRRPPAIGYPERVWRHTPCNPVT
jgi:hypothetical protein